MALPDKFSYQNVDYEARRATANRECCAVGVILLYIFVILAFIFFCIDTLQTNAKAEKANNRAVASHQFFTAVFKNDANGIEDPDLRQFYSDLTEYEKVVQETNPNETNPLLPKEIDNLYVSEDDYPHMCKFFAQFANNKDEVCRPEGILSSDFLNNYNLAKSGQGHFVVDPVDHNDGSPITLNWFIFMTLAAMTAVGIIGWLSSFYTPYEYKYRNKIQPIYKCTTGAVILGLLSWPFATRQILGNLKVRRILNNIEKKKSQRHFHAEILELERKISALESLPNSRSTKINNAITRLNQIKRDLESHDQKFSEQTMEYLADEYVRNAELYDDDAKARLDALKDVENL